MALERLELVNPPYPPRKRVFLLDEIGLRESPVTLGTESCGKSCRDFAGEAPTKLLARNYAHGHDSIGFQR